MQPLLIALQFLTCLPVRLRALPSPAEVGRSLAWYPAVGGIVGALLCLAAWATAGAAAPLQAALLLALWAGLTGVLHLDGLADSADAWLGGLGDRERTLAIMKDPRSGPVAIVTVVLLLLLKFAALWSLLEAGPTWALLLVPVLGRAAPPALFLCTPYVRAGGLGQALAEHLPRGAVLAGLLLVAVAVASLGGGPGLWALLATVLVFGWVRRALLARLGGTTGDTAGALLELVECAALVAWALAG